MAGTFGVLYDVDLTRHSWPVEVPGRVRDTAFMVVKVADIPMTIWEVRAEEVVEVAPCRRVHHWGHLYRGAWSTYKAPRLPPEMWTAVNVSWAQMLATDHKKVLAGALAMCAFAVLDNLEAHVAEVDEMAGQARNIKNNWRRQAHAVLREAAAAARGQAYAAVSLEEWLQGVDEQHLWCQARLNWSQFMREPPLLPWVSLKVTTCSALREEPLGKTLALCRRLWHQNMVFRMFAEPILGHVVGVVGQSTKAGTRLWGDFRVLKDVPGLRFCPCWAANVENELLRQNYYSLRSEAFRASQQTVAQFWAAGRRISCLSFSPDGYSMLVDVGNQESMTAAMRFERGCRLYMVVFSSAHQIAFEEKCFGEAIRQMQQTGMELTTLKQLLGVDKETIPNLTVTWFPHGVGPAALVEVDEEQIYF